MDSLIQPGYDFLYGGEVTERHLAKHRPTIVSLIILYVTFVTWVGPALMKNRRPYELKKIIFVYNFFQVVVNLSFSYKLYRFMYEVWDHRCGLKTNPEYEAYVKRMEIVFWHIYLVKLLDFFDTIFFVLRKKYGQVTVLHVFHHATMVFVYHASMGGRIGFYVVLGIANNVFIHCCTYTYYTLSGLGPHVQKYLWWKRYLTELQMLQFVIDIGYMVYAFSSGCEEVQTWDILMLFFAIVILLLMVNFYVKAYMKNKKE